MKKKNKTQNTHTPVFTVVRCTRVKTREQPKYPSTEGWIKKMWYVDTMEYYLFVKKDEIGSFIETSFVFSINPITQISIIIFYNWGIWAEQIQKRLQSHRTIVLRRIWDSHLGSLGSVISKL